MDQENTQQEESSLKPADTGSSVSLRTELHNNNLQPRQSSPSDISLAEHPDSNWLGMLAQLQRHTKLPTGGEYTGDKKTDLYRWLLYQEFLFKLRQTDSPDALSDEQLKLLNAIGYFIKTPKDPSEKPIDTGTTENLTETKAPSPALVPTSAQVKDVWDRKYLAVKDCMERGVDFRTEDALMSWISEQREEYYDFTLNKLKAYGNDSRLSDEQVQKLLASGIDLDPYDKIAKLCTHTHQLPLTAWDRVFVSVKQYTRDGFLLNAVDAPELWRWISNQREESIKWATGDDSAKVSWKQIEMLRQFGFNFDPTGKIAEIREQRKRLKAQKRAPRSHPLQIITQMECVSPSTSDADISHLPMIDATFWALSSSRYGLTCRNYNSTQGCSKGDHCNHIHVQITWGSETLDSIWSKCNKQLSPHILGCYNHRVNCASAYKGGQWWYTARYSSATDKPDGVGQLLIFAEGGSGAQVSRQGISWYPTEAEARHALRQVVIVTNYVKSKQLAAQVSAKDDAPDARKRCRVESESKGVSPGTKHDNFPETCEQSVLPASLSATNRISSFIPATEWQHTDDSLAQKPEQDLPQLFYTWIKKRGGRSDGGTCQEFKERNQCKTGSVCKGFHYLNSSVPVPKLHEIRREYFCISRQQVENCIHLEGQQSQSGKQYYTAGFRYGFFVVLAEGCGGNTNGCDEVWWYDSETEAKEAVYARLCPFL